MKIITKSGKSFSSLSRKNFVLKVKSLVKFIIYKIKSAFHKAVDAFLNELITIGDWSSQKLEIRNPDEVKDV